MILVKLHLSRQYIHPFKSKHKTVHSNALRVGNVGETRAEEEKRQIKVQNANYCNKYKKNNI